MTLDEFERIVFQTAYESPLCGVPSIRRLTPTSETIRVPLTSGEFVDAFYNAQTGTTAFALIRDQKRIFGADNTGGWHLHPFENPDEHLALSQAMSFADFIAAIEKYYSGKEIK